jgi:penicillin-binding protein 1C
MARRARLDVKPTRKIKFNPPEILQAALIFVGKPLYFLLTYLIIAILSLFYLLGRAGFFLLDLIKKLAKIKFSKPKLPKHKIIYRARPRISFPKIVLPKIRFRVSLGLISKLVLILILISLVFLFWFYILKDLPSPKTLITREIEVSTKIYDRNGILLYKIYKDKNRTLVSLDKVPLQVRLATLAAEDAEFYSHPGFSIRGIIRAIFKNLQKGELSGGSTITQQLVKNALLSSEKTLIRKIREIVLSIGVELTFSKDQILEMYLNEVSYGGTAYGIQEASRVYFNKDVEDLSLAEAALLAGLPKSPTKYSPFGANPELALERQKEVLHLMTINKFITKEEEEKALKEDLVFAANKIPIKAPHFVMYIRQELVDKYGEEMVEKGGLEVITTLDYSIQELAEKVVKTEVEKLKGLHVGNGAALVLSPQTGEILAMVGSKDYFDLANDGNVNVTTRLRQPGSSIKIVNYAYGLSHGFTPATILDDSPVSFTVAGQPPYTPQNYDGKFVGNISLRGALAQSRNVPAVKVLASYGVSHMIEQGKKMGITTWNEPSRYGLSLTLGGGDIKLLDLAQVYATIADYGKKPNIASILEVKNYKGVVLEKKENLPTEQVVDPRVAYLLISILSDNNARAPEFGSRSYLVVPNHPEVAVKTGTSNDLKDNLTLGFNQQYLVATWVGNNDSSPMARIASGVTGASPIWNKIISSLLANEKAQEWATPSGLKKVEICGRQEWFLEENVPKINCNPSPTPIQSGPTPAPTGGQILDSGAKIQVIP